MEASKDKQHNPFGRVCPHCKELLLSEDIKLESSTFNPYDHRKKGEYKYAYTWFWCARCSYSEKDIPF
ncbi:hypothetical protein NIES4071_109910 (plasmid) [Calothrix sp. NIES-4071]|nr:hypothetical protein NIES4071_109910 [Calothrix sp. NIES-4071]BAZ65244.1 hypothetical protein NIES4105_109770 [Calothrix sp. NIES-4105]